MTSATAGPGVLFAFMAPAEENRADFHEWYPAHVDSRLAVPGFVAASLFVEGEPARRRVTVYHLETVSALSSAGYLAVRESTREETEPRIGALAEFVRVVGTGDTGTVDPLLTGTADLRAWALVAAPAVVAGLAEGLPPGAFAVIDAVADGSNVEATHLLLASGEAGVTIADRLATTPEARLVWSGAIDAPESVVSAQSREG